MSCQPSYAYRPTARPAPSQSSAFVYTEHRSRLFASGTFFRSIEQGTAENDISLETIVTQISAPFDFEVTLNVYVLGVLQETFVTPQVIVPQLPDPPICTGGISAMRAAVNDGVTGSNIIEMPVRGFDIFDRSPPGLSGLPNADPIDNCVTAFGPINLAGGDGPPSGANQPFLDSLFTGTERSIIIIATTERADGFSVDPSVLRRVQQWNGTQWIQYANTTQGACPIDGPPT
jgi:hypothetical protein